MRAGWIPIDDTDKQKQAGSFVYDIARFIGSPFSYDVAGLENIQTPGPAIFIANHLGALGPIEIIISVPIRFYPWVIANMIDFELAPEYLFNDFVHPVLHLNGSFGLRFSRWLSKISVRLLRAVGSVSIDRFGGMSTDGFRQSLRLLKEGRNLLIFPEDSLQPLDPVTLMSPFMPGSTTLCILFQSSQNTLLPVYPMAAHAHSELVTIGPPEFYPTLGRQKEEKNSFCELLEERVRSLYLDMQGKSDDILG